MENEALLTQNPGKEQKIKSGSKDLKSLEKQLIKSMAGCYKVTFQFAETFAPEKGYQYGDRKFEEAIEYVFVLEETEDMVSLQHLLFVGKKTIIKHWRQDWHYENQDILKFTDENQWQRTQLNSDAVQGTWTQKVFQVDDSPRYEGYGTWNHTDNRHFWQSVTDAPLPRREISIRNDYNILKRNSHIEIFENGDWILNQDNEKIIRKDGKDTLLCMEKGLENFFTGDYEHDFVIDWWENQKDFWKIVRQCWNEKLQDIKTIKIRTKVNDEFLYMVLFKMSNEYVKAEVNETEIVKREIQSVLDAFVDN